MAELKRKPWMPSDTALMALWVSRTREALACSSPATAGSKPSTSAQTRWTKRLAPSTPPGVHCTSRSGGVEGASRFVQRVWAEVEGFDPAVPGDEQANASLVRETHKAIKAVSEGIQGFRFNSAIAKLYAFVATVRDHAKAGGQAKREALSALLRLVAPFTPHLAEEGWTRLGEAGMILDAPWPVYDPALAADDEVTLPIQVNGKRRGEIRVARGLEPAEVEAIVLADSDVQSRLEGLTVRKIVVVKDRIVNVVVA